METRAWGSIPHATFANASSRHGWQRCTTLCDVFGYTWCFFRLVSVSGCLYSSLWIVFALLGFLSPSNRGSLATLMMVCWSFFGGQVFCFVSLSSILSQRCFLTRFGGYYSSRVYASLGGVDRRKNAFVTATVLPTYARAFSSPHLTEICTQAGFHCHLPAQFFPYYRWILRSRPI